MKTLLIDGNNFIWRAYYSGGIADNNVSTGILRFVNYAIERFTPDDVVICWDVGKSRWRSDLYPGYKSARKDKQDELELLSFKLGTVKIVRGFQIIAESSKAGATISFA